VVLICIIVVDWFVQFSCCRVVAGLTCPLTYLYVLWASLMFVQRVHDDGKECERKHGLSSWTRYCQRVRSRLIPYIYWYLCRQFRLTLPMSTWWVTLVGAECQFIIRHGQQELLGVPYSWQLTWNDWMTCSLCGVVVPRSFQFPATGIICVFRIATDWHKLISYLSSIHFYRKLIFPAVSF